MSETAHGLVSTLRLALAAPFLVTGAVLTVGGYTITLLAERIAGSDS